MKKSIFKRIGLIALAVCVAIGSFFVSVTKERSNVASANSSTLNYSFNGSSLFIPLLFYDESNSYNFGNIVHSFSLSNGELTFSVDGSFGFIFNRTGNVNYYGSTIYNHTTATSNTTYLDEYYFKSFTFPFDAVVNRYRLGFLYLKQGYPSTQLAYARYYIYSNSADFIPDIYSITLTNETLYLEPENELIYNVVYYNDVNGNYLKFCYPLYSSDTGFLVQAFTTRTYFINTDLSDNQIYNQGYQQGLADNQSNIYNNGYNAGYDVGFGQGRQDGIVEANDYSFISLIGAVVDVPVQTIRGMLNFTFLGINLFDFLMGLIAILVILFIVKLVRGG